MIKLSEFDLVGLLWSIHILRGDPHDRETVVLATPLRTLSAETKREMFISCILPECSN